jgi:putative ABC transport system permease protein
MNVRYACRALLRTPAATAMAVATLALGIGANTAIFTVVNSILLRPLPYPESERLVTLLTSFPKVNVRDTGVSDPEVLDYRSLPEVFATAGGYMRRRGNLAGTDQPSRVWIAAVGEGFFATMAVPPARGRVFLPLEPNAIVLSDALWKRAFGADPGVVGRSVLLDRQPHVITGVMPPGFAFPAATELWKPWVASPSAARSARYLDFIARLKPGVSRETAQQDINRVVALLQQRHPENYTGQLDVRMRVASLHEELVGDTRPALRLLMGAVALVLLVACANVANLQLARAAERRREIAVCSALGAGRWRVLRGLLAESLVLSLLGAAGGVFLAMWGVDLLLALAPSGVLPRAGEIHIDLAVLGFTALVALASAVVFGLAPAWQAARVDLREALAQGGHGASPSRQRSRLRGVLVAAEVALALALSVAGVLLLRSFARLRAVDPGFRPERVLTFEIERPADAVFFSTLIERVEGMPGVAAAGTVTALPFSGNAASSSFSIEGRPDMDGTPDDVLPACDFHAVTPRYFETMGIPLLRGRIFSAADAAASEPVAVINQTLAQRFFAPADPLGKRIKIGGQKSRYPWVTIAGVAGDVRHRRLDGEVRPAMFLAYGHPRTPPAPFTFFVVRTVSYPAPLAQAVRQEVAALDKNQPVENIRTMTERVAGSIGARRFQMTLLAAFAALAVSLAAAGIYGVMACAVAQRTREIGIRMALGSPARDVLRLVLRQGMSYALAGITVGLAASAALSSVLKDFLYEVVPTDPATFVGVAAALAFVAAAACWLPARRATRVDPLEALRYE